MNAAPAQAWLQASRPLIDEYRHRSGAPTVAVALTDRQGTMSSLCVTSEGDGGHPLSASPVPIGSITKTIVALAVLRSAAAGRLALDHSLARWLHEFDVPEWRAVTVDDVLRHRGGLSIGSVAAPWSRAATFFATTLPRFADMQSSFYYSNVGYEALGYLLERVHDAPLGDVLERVVCKPLGMNTAIGRIHDNDRGRIPAGYCSRDEEILHWVGDELASAPWEAFTGGAGCCAASLEDVCSLLHDVLATSTQRRAKFASEWTAMLEPTDAARGVDYGRGLFRDRSLDRDIVYHAGGMLGHRCLAMADLRASLGVVVLTDLGGPLRGTLLLRLGHALLQAAVDPARVRGVSYECDVDATVEGCYEEIGAEQSERFTITANGGAWQLTSAGLCHAVQWTEIDRCLAQTAPWHDFELRFERGANGSIVRAHHGSRCFIPSGHGAGTSVCPGRSQRGLAGVYRSRNPWAPFVRVSEGVAGLMIHVAPLEGRLAELPEGGFRVAGTPELVRFEDWRDGQPAALNLSGARYDRVGSLRARPEPPAG